MFEVVVTYRSDFSEHPVNCYPSQAEAQEAAQRLAVQNYSQIVRARVRAVRQAPTKTEVDGPLSA